MKTALLLVNLGTPASTKTRDVRAYLREFLSDPYVLDIPALARWLLLNFVILPLRPRRSGKLYQKIWTERGSPLLFHSEDLRDKVASILGPKTPVRLAMRYGEPAFAKVLSELQAEGVERLLVFPLYPQYALSSTETAKARVLEVLGELGWQPKLQWLAPFHSEPEYIECLARSFREGLSAEGFSHVLFGFHGLPERHVKKTDPTGQHCLKSPSCCDVACGANKDCYRAQCFSTARLLAQRLGLRPAQYTVAFQSRLGRDPWIKPYMEEVVRDLGKDKVKNLVAICPAFTADCLETLEETKLQIGGEFLKAGGTRFDYVPCLNSRDDWAAFLASKATRMMQD